MGGIQFNGQVTVYGSVINIEGNQYNMASGKPDKKVFRNFFESLIRSSADRERLAEVMKQFFAMPDAELLDPTEVKTVATDLAEAVKSEPKLCNRLAALASDLTVGASGSLLATAIVEGIRIIIGG